MDGLLKWLLTTNGVSGSGVLLTVLVMGAIALQRRWIVMGWVYNEACKDRDTFKATLTLRHDADMADVGKLRERADQLTAQVEELRLALAKNEARRTRTRSPE